MQNLESARLKHPFQFSQIDFGLKANETPSFSTLLHGAYLQRSPGERSVAGSHGLEDTSFLAHTANSQACSLRSGAPIIA